MAIDLATISPLVDSKILRFSCLMNDMDLIYFEHVCHWCFGPTRISFTAFDVELMSTFGPQTN